MNWVRVNQWDVNPFVGVWQARCGEPIEKVELQANEYGHLQHFAVFLINSPALQELRAFMRWACTQYLRYFEVLSA